MPLDAGTGSRCIFVYLLLRVMCSVWEGMCRDEVDIRAVPPFSALNKVSHSMWSFLVGGLAGQQALRTLLSPHLSTS